MRLYNIQMTADEARLTARALARLLDGHTAPSVDERVAVENLLDYIENETGVRT